MIKCVDRYIGSSAVLGILAVWISLTILMMMFNLLDELRSSDAGYGASDIFWFVFLTMPRFAYQVFPVSALLGALIGVGGLAAANELVAFRTSGVSRLRIAGSALAGTLFLAAPVMVMGEWLAPVLEQQARAFKHSQIMGQVLVGELRGMWMRDRNEIVNIQRPLLSADTGQPSVLFRNVVIYSFSDDSKLQQITRARSATHDGEQWILERVTRILIGEEGVKRQWSRTAPWDTGVKPELLDSAVIRPKNMSIRALWGQLEYLGQNGLDDRVYQSAFWSKIFYPFTALALVLAGMPFVFGSARHHNLGVRIFIGMSLGSVFMIANRAFQNMGNAYGMPAYLSTTLLSLLLAVTVVLILRRSV